MSFKYIFFNIADCGSIGVQKSFQIIFLQTFCNKIKTSLDQVPLKNIYIYTFFLNQKCLK